MHFSRNSSAFVANVVTTVNAGRKTPGLFSSIQLISIAPIQISGCVTCPPELSFKYFGEFFLVRVTSRNNFFFTDRSSGLAERDPQLNFDKYKIERLRCKGVTKGRMVCVQHSSLLHHFIFLLEIGGLQVLLDKRALR